MNENSQNSLEKQWYLFKSVGGNEHNVIKKLQTHSEFDKYFQDNFIVLSDYEKTNKKKGPNTFSGYFLGQMLNESLSNTILRRCGAYIVKEYKEEDIKILIDNIIEQTNLTLNKNFSIKEVVKIQTGLINQEGTIISLNEEKKTAIVQIIWFDALTSVEVPFDNLEKLKN